MCWHHLCRLTMLTVFNPFVVSDEEVPFHSNGLLYQKEFLRLGKRMVITGGIA